MLHSNANDQSTEPFQSRLGAPWQGSEKESYREERQYWEGRRSHQPNLEGNRYWSEAPSYEVPREEFGQSAWQESPPLRNTSGKLSVAPTVKLLRSGSHSMIIVALTLVVASVFGAGLFAGWTSGKGVIG